MKQRTFGAIVLGASAGGMAAVATLVKDLPADFPLPLILCQHIHASAPRNFAAAVLRPKFLQVKEAEEKEQIQAGFIYVAPPSYHLLLEQDRSFSLSNEAPVNWSRPSIDVLFETAAEAYQDRLIGIILSGANHDGAQGLKKIKEYGGLTIAQDPAEAEMPMMPQAAINLGTVDFILPLRQITALLLAQTSSAFGMEFST